MSTIGNSTNITWHKSSVEKLDRQELLQQKGCVIWITGLSGSGLLIDQLLYLIIIYCLYYIYIFSFEHVVSAIISTVLSSSDSLPLKKGLNS